MPADVKIKICGLTDPADIPAAIVAGASYIGLNFFPKSPRYLDLQAAAEMARSVPDGIASVGLVVDADDAMLDELTAAVPLDMLQLHGRESPARVAEVRRRYGLPVIKAVGIAVETDLSQIDFYAKAADQLLVDTKPPPDASRPGGNARTFDWRLLSGRRWTVPWMLAGGLTAGNVAEAIGVTGARQVDVSSGVETAPGVKDATLMMDFTSAVRA